MPSQTAAIPRLGALLFWPMLAIAIHPPATAAQDPAPTPRITLRKCVAADGGIAYQSEPCVARAREIWTREAALEQPKVAANAEAGTAATRPVGRTVARGADERSATRHERCDAARAQAARKRDREWNRLGFEALSRLDAWVAQRCR